MLSGVGVHPLCFLAPPRSSDFTLRYTTFMFSSHGTYTYSGRSGRLFVDVNDEAWSPSEHHREESKLGAARFRALLEDAGLNSLWQADDPDCDPHTTVTVEVGSIIEFQDAKGYHIREAPRAQVEGCTTTYGKTFRDVKDIVDELDAVPNRQ